MNTVIGTKQRRIFFLHRIRWKHRPISEVFVVRSEAKTETKKNSVSVFVYDSKNEKNSVLPNTYDVSIVYEEYIGILCSKLPLPM